jgi:hypothetical protein
MQLDYKEVKKTIIDIFEYLVDLSYTKEVDEESIKFVMRALAAINVNLVMCRDELCAMCTRYKINDNTDICDNCKWKNYV